MHAYLALLLRAAIERRDRPAVLRFAREQAGWSQTRLARLAGFHPSTISRFESGARPLNDVATLRRLADVLPVPRSAFGLDDPEGAVSRHDRAAAPRVRPERYLEEDDVRRRDFLKAGGMAVGAAVAGSAAAPVAAAAPTHLPDPAAVLTARLADVLVASAPGPVTPPALLARGIAAARAAFDRCDYLALADTLPRLVRGAETLDDPATLSRVYILATRALVKLRPGGLEWLGAERAVRTARSADHPLLLAEAERMMSSVFRRAGDHERAKDLVLGAADRLALDGADPRHLTLHARLLCTGGYSAARAGDGARARDLLADAAVTTGRLTGDDATFARANLLSHRVSVEHLLDEPGAALHHARTAGRIAFPSVEREGRLLVDLAAAHLKLGHHGAAYNAVLEAERRAPGEVRTRAAARSIVTDLLAQNRVTLPDIQGLAVRVHAPAVLS